METDFYVKFSKITFPKGKAVQNEFFIANVEISYEYNEKYSQIDDYLDLYPDLRRKFPAVFNVLYETIGWEQHKPNLISGFTSVKGYAKYLDINKIYKINGKGIEKGKSWKDKDNNIHEGSRVLVIDKIYEITNINTLEDFQKANIKDSKCTNVTLPEKEIKALVDSHVEKIESMKQKAKENKSR